MHPGRPPHSRLTTDSSAPFFPAILELWLERIGPKAA